MNNAVETPDIFRGAYLLCCGARLIDTRVARHQVRFVIEGNGLAEHDERYRLGTALVNPVQLREALNLLRDLIYERLKKGDTRDGSHPGRRDRTAQAPH